MDGTQFRGVVKDMYISRTYLVDSRIGTYTFCLWIYVPVESVLCSTVGVMENL